MNAIVPIPKCDIAIRVATMEHLPFLDALQKKHTKALGYFPTKQFEGYIEMGAVLVAEEVRDQRSEISLTADLRPLTSSALTSDLCPLTSVPVGYIISRDRYLKRDELGVIYQLCVEPGAQRKLVGATLVKEVFERSAYGCRLYCCWCAQDLQANHFWESMGFVPVAFRAGSTGKRRVHIFWQRRTSADDTATPWWYPSQTNAGAIREDRLVFPIPPGTHWSEVQAVAIAPAQKPALEDAAQKAPRAPRKPRATKPTKPKAPMTTAATAMRFGPAPASVDAGKSIAKPAAKRLDRPKVPS